MLRSLIPCIVFCAISALVLGQKHAGFMLFFFGARDAGLHGNKRMAHTQTAAAPA